MTFEIPSRLFAFYVLNPSSGMHVVGEGSWKDREVRNFFPNSTLHMGIVKLESSFQLKSFQHRDLPKCGDGICW